jgi:pyruvate dehydrogenase E1 component alpha subunit
MYSERVNGDDPLAVRDAMRRAVDIARSQHEPSLIEALSYRFRGHSVVDPDRYRPKDEVAQGRQHDPISIFGERLKAAGMIDDNGLSEVEERVQREVDDAVNFAEESPNPPVEGLMDYNYAPDSMDEEGE